MNFDWKIYRLLNPDLINAGLNTEIQLENHYRSIGLYENRICSIYDLYPNFNPDTYKNIYSDLKNMNNRELTLHWLNNGRFEGRTYIGLISIVMAYYNKKEQLSFTLKTIAMSEYKNIEVIIVDDASSKDEELDNSIINKYNFKIKLIKIKKEEKTWVNPCVPYNIGLKEATGNIVIIQNPEVCHIGDCISYVAKNLKLNQWLTLNCYGLGNFNDNKTVYDIYNNGNLGEIFNFITKYNAVSNAGSLTGDVRGWLNHLTKLFTAYHYFGAIYRSDLIGKMNGGFDQDYKDGVCFDDNDFIKRLIYNKFEFVINNFTQKLPYVIHLYHRKSEAMSENIAEKHNINRKVFDKKCALMNLDNYVDISLYKYMPVPKIIN